MPGWSVSHLSAERPPIYRTYVFFISLGFEEAGLRRCLWRVEPGCPAVHHVGGVRPCLHPLPPPHAGGVRGPCLHPLPSPPHIKVVGSSCQCCGSGMFIPDPTFFHPGSKFCPSRIRIKEFKYFNPKKWLSSRKFDPGSSSRIRILTFFPSWIPDPGVKKAPDPGYRIRIRNTGSCLSCWKEGLPVISPPATANNTAEGYRLRVKK